MKTTINDAQLAIHNAIAGLLAEMALDDDEEFEEVNDQMLLLADMIFDHLAFKVTSVKDGIATAEMKVPF